MSLKKWFKKWFSNNSQLVNEIIELKQHNEDLSQQLKEQKALANMWKGRHQKLLDEFRQQYEFASQAFEKFINHQQNYAD